MPEYVARLREKVGHDELWLTGVNAVVLRGEPGAEEVLVDQRADNGRWEIPCGTLDPGEDPDTAVVREVFEETGVTVEPVRLLAVQAHGPVEFPNGDRCRYLALGFHCRVVAGEASVNDDESLAVRWAPVGDLPDLHPRHLDMIRSAVEGRSLAYGLEGRRYQDPPPLQ